MKMSNGFIKQHFKKKLFYIYCLSTKSPTKREARGTLVTYGQRGGAVRRHVEMGVGEVTTLTVPHPRHGTHCVRSKTNTQKSPLFVTFFAKDNKERNEVGSKKTVLFLVFHFP